MEDQRLAEIEKRMEDEQPAEWRDDLHNAYLEDVPALIAEIRRLKNQLSYLQACQL